MVRKKIAMAVLALSALQADIASALGLGNVAVKSSLNQPLDAEIRLFDAGDLDETQIRVQLAAPEDFQRAGVERDYFLTNLRFNVELDQRGNGVIRVTTREAVVEPYLNFIVETRWPSGRLLREYAVLLDPPTFSAAPAPAATGSALATVQQRTQSPAVGPRVSQQSAAGASPRPQLTQPAATGPGEYRVQHNDTLSSIAARFRPSGDVNLQQTMVAIQQANPEAFIRGNINLVKSGYVLRIPSADAVRAVSADVALATVREHNEAWRSGRAPATTLAGPQLDARRPAASDDAGPQERERLSIATAGDSDRLTASDGAAAGAGEGAALRDELAAARESLDSARRENAELESRLDDMERQIATLQRLLTLKDDQLAALQAAAGDTTEAAPPATAPAAPDTAPAATDASQPQPAPATAPASSSGSLIDDLMAMLWLPIAGGAALILLAALIIAQRRRAAAEREALAALEEDDTPPVVFAADEQLDRDDVVVSDDGIAPRDEVEAAAEEAAASEAPAAEPVRSQTGDAVAEADIYIAYGRYQQAVDLLQSAIAQEPARSDLRVKLLEVYLEMRERDAFRAEFRQLLSLGDELAVAQVKELLSSVDGVDGWLDDLGDTPASASLTGAAALGAAALGGAAAAAMTGAEDDTETSDAEDELIFDREEPVEEEGPLLDLDDLVTPQDGTEQELDFSDLELDTAELGTSEPETAEEDADVNLFGLDDLEFEERSEESRVEAAAADEADGTGSEAPADEPAAETLADDAELELDGELDLEGDLDLDLSELEQESLDAAFDAFEVEPTDELEQEIAAFDLPATELSPAEPAEPAADDEAISDADLDAAFNELMSGLDEPADTSETAAEESAAPASGGFELEGLGDLEEIDELDELESLDSLGELPGATSTAATDEDEDVLGELDEFAAALAGDTDDESGDDLLADDALEPAAEETPFGTDLPDLTDLEPYTPELAAADAEDEFDFLADADEVATKLDLARAYIDMGDTAGARDILDEVVVEGTDPQKEEAQSLLSRIS
ncbi:MAG: FimV/HubP family polar landmark protein [Spongiibacteraceae bacterium]|jgi:pilus assembly protein FimV|nr:FimV/HubP family polar landmark protein [Spongiibacteraceae bacterium]